MNCQEALNLLYDIIDKEATEVDEKAVKEHLEHCRHCSEIYRLESVVNDFVQAKLQRSVSHERLESLRSRIVVELDSMDEPEKSGKKKIPFSRLTMMLAAAASLVLLIGLGLIASKVYTHQGDMAPLVQAHQQLHENLDSFADSESTASLIDNIEAEMGYSVSSAVYEFNLKGARVETLMGVEMAHFLYVDSEGSRTVSVFIAPAAEFNVPEVLHNHETVRDNVSYFDHDCSGCRMMLHRMGDVVVITATTDKDVELLDFIPGHTAI